MQETDTMIVQETSTKKPGIVQETDTMIVQETSTYKDTIKIYIVCGG